MNPTTKPRPRPNRSPMRPPSSSRPPKARVWAVMAHCRLPSVMPRSRWADGRATLTIVMSSTTISWARAMTPRPHQRRGSGGGGASPPLPREAPGRSGPLSGGAVSTVGRAAFRVWGARDRWGGSLRGQGVDRTAPCRPGQGRALAVPGRWGRWRPTRHRADRGGRGHGEICPFALGSWCRGPPYRSCGALTNTTRRRQEPRNGHGHVTQATGRGRDKAMGTGVLCVWQGWERAGGSRA